MAASSIIAQTAYAELLERCASAAFNESFPVAGSFISKSIKGKKYWYFQQPTSLGRTQQYVGAETPELLERIARHKEVRDDERERRKLVSALVRSFGMARPAADIGAVIAALSREGVFRLGGVLVGTAAYQSYVAMLGVRLDASSLHTADVDIAQSENISVVIEDQAPVLEILQKADKTFRPIPHLHRKAGPMTYEARSKLRVDMLTPNDGPETDAPRMLKTLKTGAQPLRFLSYLIRDPEPAAILHEAGIYVRVPSPQRFAIHKLIVARRRHPGSAKSDKDIQQAGALLEILAQKRPYELQSAWQEAVKRGPKWRRLIVEGLSSVNPTIRDAMLKVVGEYRSILPGIDLTFQNPQPRYDSNRGVLTFEGHALGSRVQCSVSREALDDYFRISTSDNNVRIEKFIGKRSIFEAMARTKYLSWPVEEPGQVLIRTMETEKLVRKKMK